MRPRVGAAVVAAGVTAGFVLLTAGVVGGVMAGVTVVFVVIAGGVVAAAAGLATTGCCCGTCSDATRGCFGAPPGAATSFVTRCVLTCCTAAACCLAWTRVA